MSGDFYLYLWMLSFSCYLHDIMFIVAGASSFVAMFQVRMVLCHALWLIPAISCKILYNLLDNIKLLLLRIQSRDGSGHEEAAYMASCQCSMTSCVCTIGPRDIINNNYYFAGT